MNTKFLLIAFSVASIVCSCTTAYKSGQTPDDVYYSPARIVEEKRNDEKTQDKSYQQNSSTEDKRIRMCIRDRRWRDLDDEYNYGYSVSPYGYSNCSCNNYGYYYNPYYYKTPVYSTNNNSVITPNQAPRTVNLNTYKNYNNAVTSSTSKNGEFGTSTTTPSKRYNNSNNGTRVGNIIRQVITPSGNSNNSTQNNSRTYTPSSNSSSSSSSSSNSGSSSGGSVTRPGRG